MSSSSEFCCATIASNDGFKEAAASTSVMLQFEGVSVLADPNSDLEAELRQINPASDNPDQQHLKVADPSRVFFLGSQIMLLPLRPLHPGTSYNFTLPAGVVRHFDQPFSFVFTTRPEDHVAPSIVWTWPMMSVSKLTIDRMLVHLYFSEEVKPGMSKFVVMEDGNERFRFDVSQDLCEEGLFFRGCLRLDLAGRRLSLLPAGLDDQGRMLPWADAGRPHFPQNPKPCKSFSAPPSLATIGRACLS
ncbi:hypothetical protein AK812_SmicGene19819 [Symbiodinium microadriaticum]|uniref:SbsA Ig-like domain-containing protein n=1 Tax=Symbiodinium microadriaticum TaxID=2951 RepID=A0A1Q9DRM1_SYMMI|nr:hypothetical protein AK812_SmicGene19819 [Symbiodinium microadriaticum]